MLKKKKREIVVCFNLNSWLHAAIYSDWSCEHALGEMFAFPIMPRWCYFPATALSFVSVKWCSLTTPTEVTGASPVLQGPLILLPVWGTSGELFAADFIPACKRGV